MESENSIWLIESPVVMVEREEIAYSVDWQGAANVANPAATIYKNGMDITDLTMDGEDEHVINGNVLTLKRLRAGDSDGGARYVLVVEADVDGNRERRKLLVRVVRAAAES
ncbi:MAG: hypothetical protein WEA61_03640 [Anaerolineales bacterium]